MDKPTIERVRTWAAAEDKAGTFLRGMTHLPTDILALCDFAEQHLSDPPATPPEIAAVEASRARLQDDLADNIGINRMPVNAEDIRRVLDAFDALERAFCDATDCMVADPPADLVETLARAMCNPMVADDEWMTFRAQARSALTALAAALREDDGAAAAIMNANSMVLRNAASAQLNALCDYLGSDE